MSIVLTVWVVMLVWVWALMKIAAPANEAEQAESDAEQIEYLKNRKAG